LKIHVAELLTGCIKPGIGLYPIVPEANHHGDYDWFTVNPGGPCYKASPPFTLGIGVNTTTFEPIDESG
jgi:hypothetical protein